MSRYTVISDVSSGLVNILSTGLVPDIIPNVNQIFLGNPKENPRASLCIYLYDIREERGMHGNHMIREGIDRQRYPSVYMTLCYMITALSGSESKFRALEEQKILGRVIQVLNEHCVLDKTNYKSTEENHPANLRIMLQNIEHDEKLKIFQAQDMPYKVSLFYLVSSVELQSTKEKDVSRVFEYQIDYVKGIGGK